MKFCTNQQLGATRTVVYKDSQVVQTYFMIVKTSPRRWSDAYDGEEPSWRIFPVKETSPRQQKKQQQKMKQQ